MSSTEQEGVTESLNFPCKMLSLLFVASDGNEGEICFLDILTDMSKKDFIINLARALTDLKRKLDRKYYVNRKTITFKNREYYDGFVAAKKINSEKIFDKYGYETIYRFIQIAPNEILPIQNLLNNCESVELAKQIATLVAYDGDVFYNNFIDV